MCQDVQDPEGSTPQVPGRCWGGIILQRVLVGGAAEPLCVMETGFDPAKGGGSQMLQ